MENRQKVLIAAFAVVLMLFSSLVVMTQDNDADSRYTIQVVTNPDFPPYEYMVSEDYEGIDMDIWKAIAKTLDCNVNFNVMDFDSIINAIEAGRYDVGASGFTVTEERKLQINFSNTYATAHQTVVVKKNSSQASATSWDELTGSVSVESGTTGYYLAEDDYGTSRLSPYNTYSEVIQGVVSGHDGFAVLDDLVAESFVEKYSNIMILDISLPGDEIEEYAFTFNKSNAQMLQYTNKAMDYLKGTGVIDDIFNYYGSIGYDPETPGYFSTHLISSLRSRSYHITNLPTNIRSKWQPIRISLLMTIPFLEITRESTWISGRPLPMSLIVRSISISWNSIPSSMPYRMEGMRSELQDSRLPRKGSRTSTSPRHMLLRIRMCCC